MSSTELAERMQSAQVAQQEGQQASLLTQLEDPKFKAQLARVKSIDPERYLRLALTEIRKNPKLLRCTPQSFLGAVMTGAQLGLEPDVRGLAYLIPRWNGKTRTNDCTFMVGYRGYLDLARRSGVDVQAEVVYEHDFFDFEYGTDRFLRHKPVMTDRGAPIAAYAVAGKQFMVLSVSEIEKRRGRAQAGDKGPWTTDWDAMARKTAVRALAAYLPQTVELAQAALLDETVRTDIDSSLEDVKIPEPEDEPEDTTIPDAEVVDETSGEPGAAGQAPSGDDEPGSGDAAEDPLVAVSPDDGDAVGEIPPSPAAPVEFKDGFDKLDRDALVKECRKRRISWSGSWNELLGRIREYDGRPM